MTNNLFVGGFPYETTSEELAEFFRPCGAVASVKILMERDTGRSRGLAFVEMSTEAGAQAAIDKLNGTVLGSRKVFVSEARPKETRPGSGPGPVSEKPGFVERRSGKDRRRPTGAGPSEENRRGGKPFFGAEKKKWGDKPSFGDKKKPWERKPGFGDEKKKWGDKPSFGDKKKPWERKPGFGDEKKKWGDKPSFGDKKKPWGDKPSFGDKKKPWERKPSFGDKKKPWSGKPSFGDAKKKWTGKPGGKSRPGKPHKFGGGGGFSRG